AQAEAVDRPLLVADADRAPSADELLVVTARELLSRPFTGLVGLAADHRRQTAVRELHRALLVRVVRERGAWVDHLERVVEQHDFALVRDRELLERADDVEAHAGRVERVVRVHLGPLEHERDAPVGQVDAHGHLAGAFVGAVGETEEPADVRRGVVHVEVHRLVEVRLGAELVEVLVLRFESYAHAGDVRRAPRHVAGARRARPSGCGRSARSSTAARRPARPTNTTARGCNQCTRRATRAWPARYSSDVSSSAPTVARLTRSVKPM